MSPLDALTRPGYGEGMSAATAPEARRSRADGKRRLTADLPADVAETLDETARLLGYNKLTTLIRALRVFGALVQVEKAGGSVVITEADGTRSKLIVQ